MTKKKNNNEKGNAFFIILVGVVLFAALSFTFTKTSQNTTQNISKAEAKVASSSIINKAKTIERAVQKLLRRGCSESELSFENSHITGYEHLQDTRDECKVFESVGGNIKYSTPDSKWLDDTQSKEKRYNEWYIPTDICVWEGKKTKCDPNPKAELLIIIPYIKKEVCSQINKNLQITGIPKDTNTAFSFNNPFRGTVSTGASPTDIEVWENKTGCFEGKQSPKSGTYHFFHVLISR